MQKVKIYDTTLRDGTQGEGMSLSVADKVRIARKLDEFGVHYIEGGWPGSNPKDREFFEVMKTQKLKNAKLTAFGSTHLAKNTPETDENLKELVDSGVTVATIFGKSWTVHVEEVLRISPERNLEIIEGSVKFLKKNIATVFYDAEHFFDGYKNNPEYALLTLKAAKAGGADCLVLCDTNGGSLPDEVTRIVAEVKKQLPNVPLGIHTHNDGEMAVANTLAAVKAGATQIQGTLNGVGERCGNANLCSIIPTLQLKLGIECVPKENLVQLQALSRYFMELANLPSNHFQAYTGRSAFTHKGGVHTSAVSKNPHTYEHIQPEHVGNKRRILVSDLAGRASIVMKAKELGIELDPKNPVVAGALKKLKELENSGFQFEIAEASFELLLSEALGRKTQFFELISRRVIDERKAGEENPQVEALVKIRVGNKLEETIASGDGPVNALDRALRKALEKYYPVLKEMKLLDYKVRVLPGRAGTAARVRVLIESANGEAGRWHTMGVSYDVIEASWQALSDSVNYKLYKAKG
ncbi:MAG: citramalate synthase [Parcubacteria group bacterium]